MRKIHREKSLVRSGLGVPPRTPEKFVMSKQEKTGKIILLSISHDKGIRNKKGGVSDGDQGPSEQSVLVLKVTKKAMGSHNTIGCQPCPGFE